ncbi:MAG: hypothetical protein ABSB15_11855 [Bryobacteraceae bacterium]
MPFICSICEEESTRICVSCTKDTCGNHLCEKCGSCSDCCSCEVALDLSEEPPRTIVRAAQPFHDSPHSNGYAEPAPEESGN